MQAVILAAGDSTRFWPLGVDGHKSLVKVMGRPLIAWTIESLFRAQVDDVIIVQSPARAVERALGQSGLPRPVRFVIQEKSVGMGHALLCAEPQLKDTFFVVNPQHVTADRVIPGMLAKSQATGARIVLAGAATNTPWTYGVFSLAGDRITDLVEKPQPGKEPSDIRIVGVYLLPKEYLDAYRQIPIHDDSTEDALRLMLQSWDARVVLLDEQPPTLKYPWDLFPVVKALMAEQLKPHVAPGAQVAHTAVITGNVCVDEGAVIHDYAVVKGPCYIGRDSVVGTHSFVRDYTNLERGVVIGAHAEVTRCVFQEEATTHSGYFGDSLFDALVKIGAGTVTANVRVDRGEISATVQGERVNTGRRRLGAVVGQETHIGISAMLMPGVLIGPRCQIGPGTLVSRNVDADTTYYAKPKELARKRKS